MKASTRRAIIIISVVLLAILAIVLAVSLTGPTEITMYSTEKDNKGLQQEFYDGNVESLLFEGNYKVKIKLKGDKGYGHFCYISSRPAFEETLRIWLADDAAKSKEVSIKYNDPSSSSMLSSILVPIIMLVVLAGIFMLIMRKSAGANNQALSFGKTKADAAKNVKVRFNDVAGADEEKQELQEIVEFLKSPKKFTDIGARIPKGVLLVGPPGTGKTLFAKAVAGEANVPFFAISGSDFVEMFVGVGASRVRDLFEQAKKNMPCIIFIDEIDAVGRQRGAGMGGGNDEREQTLNQLLVQMDGFETNSSIIVMAATNRSDILDPALMRPGRFDRQIYVNIPDVRGREAIFKVHSRNKPLAPDVNFKSIARMTAGFTGADIENLLNEAAILAAREDRKLITNTDISEAINKVIAGPAKKSRLVTESDKRITAYHEAGHAIVAKLMKHCESVHEVSIIPRGLAAGYTITLPENDDNHMTKGKLLDEIAMLLAGRAAEEIVIKDISTGASNDIQRASGIARKMVTEWGMSDTLGNMFLGSSEEVFLGRDYQTQLSYSDDVAAKIDLEVKRILDEQYKISLSILKENRVVLDRMVKLLYDKETIYENEIDALIAGKDIADIMAEVAKTDDKKADSAKSGAVKTEAAKAEIVKTEAVTSETAKSETAKTETISADFVEAEVLDSEEIKPKKPKKTASIAVDAPIQVENSNEDDDNKGSKKA